MTKMDISKKLYDIMHDYTENEIKKYSNKISEIINLELYDKR